MKLNWWESIVFIGVITALGALGFHFHARRIKKQVSAVLSTRSQLTSSQYGEKYFGETPTRSAIARDLREMLASKLPYPLAGLGPDDKIQETLRMDSFDSLSSAELIMELEARFGIDLHNAPAIQNDMTIRDLVDYVEYHRKTL